MPNMGVCQTCHQVIEIHCQKTLQCKGCYQKDYQANYRKKKARPSNTEAFTQTALADVLRLTRPIFKWMLTDIKHRADEFDVEYSPELKQAIKTQQLLDMI